MTLSSSELAGFTDPPRAKGGPVEEVLKSPAIPNGVATCLHLSHRQLPAAVLFGAHCGAPCLTVCQCCSWARHDCGLSHQPTGPAAQPLVVEQCRPQARTVILHPSRQLDHNTKDHPAAPLALCSVGCRAIRHSSSQPRRSSSSSVTACKGPVLPAGRTVIRHPSFQLDRITEDLFSPAPQPLRRSATLPVQGSGSGGGARPSGQAQAALRSKPGGSSKVVGDAWQAGGFRGLGLSEAVAGKVCPAWVLLAGMQTCRQAGVPWGTMRTGGVGVGQADYCAGRACS